MGASKPSEALGLGSPLFVARFKEALSERTFVPDPVRAARIKAEHDAMLAVEVPPGTTLEEACALFRNAAESAQPPVTTDVQPT